MSFPSSNTANAEKLQALTIARVICDNAMFGELDLELLRSNEIVRDVVGDVTNQTDLLALIDAALADVERSFPVPGLCDDREDDHDHDARLHSWDDTDGGVDPHTTAKARVLELETRLLRELKEGREKIARDCGVDVKSLQPISLPIVSRNFGRLSGFNVFFSKTFSNDGNIICNSKSIGY